MEGGMQSFAQHTESVTTACGLGAENVFPLCLRQEREFRF